MNDEQKAAVERLRKDLNESHHILRYDIAILLDMVDPKPEKFEIPEGEWWLDNQGEVAPHPASIADDPSFGLAFQSREAAERCRDELHAWLKLWHWREVYRGTEQDCDVEDYTVYVPIGRPFDVSYNCDDQNDLCTITMSERAARAAADALNNGTLDLQWEDK